MAALVTTPLERQFGQISGISMMSSDSSAGLSTIVIQFDMDRDIDAAGQDVQSAINAARGTLPNNLPYPPVYNKVNPADAPILTLMLTTDIAPAPRRQRLRRQHHRAEALADRRRRPGLDRRQRAPGRARAGESGAARQSRAHDGGRAQRADAGERQCAQGQLERRRAELLDRHRTTSSPTPRTTARRSSATRTTHPVRLADVAKVIDGVENDQLAAWANGKPAVLLDIRRQPSANIVQTVEEVRKALPRAEIRAAGRRAPRGVLRSHGHDPRVGARRASSRSASRSCSSSRSSSCSCAGSGRP